MILRFDLSFDFPDTWYWFPLNKDLAFLSSCKKFLVTLHGIIILPFLGVLVERTTSFL